MAGEEKAGLLPCSYGGAVSVRSTMTEGARGSVFSKLLERFPPNTIRSCGVGNAQIQIEPISFFDALISRMISRKTASHFSDHALATIGGQMVGDPAQHVEQEHA